LYHSFPFFILIYFWNANTSRFKANEGQVVSLSNLSTDTTVVITYSAAV